MTLQLVGDGPERDRILGLVRAAGLEESVQFLGERTDLPSVLRGADLFLLPSETESEASAVAEPSTMSIARKPKRAEAFTCSAASA